ncbi:MAG: SLC13 family permease, partial [Polyangiaceae bacterium]
MQALAAYSSLLITLSLAVARPRVGEKVRIGPAPGAAIGVLVMMLAGVVKTADIAHAAIILWRPLVAIMSIMVTTSVAERVGLLEKLAKRLFSHTHGSASKIFFRVFVLSAVTAAALNNDSAVLLLTPAIVALVRHRYPRRPELVVPFAFVVFMAAGVAPFVLSNPMNMIFAAYAGIDFNAYAIRMAPIALAGWAVAALVLHLLFRKTLAAAPETSGTEDFLPLDAPQRRMVVVLAIVLCACPFVAYAGGNVWMVAAAGAILALAFVAKPSGQPPLVTIRSGISLEIVAFLILVSVLGVGMKNVGLVAWLTHLYEGGNVATIGAASAVGSALLN